MDSSRHEIILRFARPDEEQAAEAVWEAAAVRLRTIYRPNARAQRMRATNDAIWQRVVAVRDERIAGTLRFRAAADTCHIIALAVHPEFQRQGLARRLVGFVIDQARREGQRIVSLYTVLETGNVPIFERLGFRAVSQEIDKYSESDLFPTLTAVRLEYSLVSGQ